MKISIITVVYNSVDTIAQAIDSVLSQTYENVEYIIVDGVSTDGTIDIINSYESRISKFISETDHGLYDAMNKGVQMATGNVIGFLNSDDFFIDSNIIESIMSKFLKDNSLDVLYGNIQYVDRDNSSKVVRQWKSKPYYSNYFENGNVPAHPALYIRREIFFKVGDFNTLFKFSADYDFMLRLFKLHQFNCYYLDKYIVRMRLGGITSGGIKNRILQNIEIYRSWRLNKLKPPILLFPFRFVNKVKQYF